ncbi:papain family cysteine protease [Ancylostoma duodenale]|uniref:Papain family cysteine protease n=1 Tax=Ancylostoma duodenale TaxID=51022 RepID=A0A0C2DYM1_9BILA|nr:papain family cysteine protease [Ancylostoma duodenale]
MTSHPFYNGYSGKQELTGQALVDYVRTHQNLFEVEESEKNNERMKYLMPVDFVTRPRDEDRIKVVVDRKLPERCRGGWPIKAWEWVKENGVCTGGRYSAKGVCKPYAFYPCGNHTNEIWYGECPKASWPTPKCRKACKYGYRKPYEKDKYYAKSAYILPNDEEAIRKEILENGPVQAVFDVYEDFRLYKRGIYKNTQGKKTGAHAVKIYGWGADAFFNSTHTIVIPYWRIINSWNVDWGEKGYFRMIRGEDNCGIESMVTAGIMAA